MNKKAFAVSDGEHSIIVFTTTAGKAKAWGANEFGVDFIDVASVNRAKWADKYEGKEIPKEAYLAAGWWWECECGFPQTKETAIIKDDTVLCKDCV